ncbi:unknown [Anaerotruncus sp. CAG:390]|nr:unknown [Anaerotruncus sp. CAG:390]
MSTRVERIQSTSTSAAKLPEYTNENPKTSPLSSV